jgi:mRNA degradation ribonuclease J1/J2
MATTFWLLTVALDFQTMRCTASTLLLDTTYLQKNKKRIRAIVLTHGHEDHIGAIPYVMRDLDAPIYATV